MPIIQVHPSASLPLPSLTTSCCIIRPAWKTRAWSRHFSPRLRTIQQPTVTWHKAFGVHHVIFTLCSLLGLHLSSACTHSHTRTVCGWNSRIGPVTSGLNQLGNKTSLCSRVSGLLLCLASNQINTNHVHLNTFTANKGCVSSVEVKTFAHVKVRLIARDKGAAECYSVAQFNIKPVTFFPPQPRLNLQVLNVKWNYMWSSRSSLSSKNIDRKAVALFLTTSVLKHLLKTRQPN